MKKMHNDSELLTEYDFSKGIRGKYARRYAEGTNVVVIDPDIVEYFPDNESVNNSLRSLVSIIKTRQKKKSIVVRRISAFRGKAIAKR
jgi:hypothetical protein